MNLKLDGNCMFRSKLSQSQSRFRVQVLVLKRITLQVLVFDRALRNNTKGICTDSAGMHCLYQEMAVLGRGVHDGLLGKGPQSLFGIGRKMM